MTATPTTNIADPPRDAAPPPATSATSASKHDRHFRTDHLMADLKGRSVRGGAVTLSAQAVKFVLQTGSTMVLARLLTPADFGLIAMVAAFTGFVSLFKDLGLSMATIQRPEITHAQVSTLFWINVALSLLLALVAAALAPAVSWFYGEPALTWITVAIAATFIFGGLSAQHTALLRRQMRFETLALINIGSLIAGAATAIAVAWYTHSYWALVTMTAVQAGTTATMSFALSGWRPGRPQKRADTRPLLRFGSDLTAFNCINYFARNADNILIGWWLGSTALGIYSKAYGLLQLPIQQFNQPIAGVAVPLLSRIQGDQARVRSTYLMIVRTIALIIIPFAAFCIVSSDWLIFTILGPQWSSTASIFRCLGLAVAAYPITNTAGWTLASQGFTRPFLILGTISSILVIIAFTIGLSGGAEGVAIAYATYTVLVRVPLTTWTLQRVGIIEQRPLYQALVPATLIASAIYVCGWSIQHWLLATSPSLGFTTTAIASALLYVAMASTMPSTRPILNHMLTGILTRLIDKRKCDQLPA